MKVELNCAFVRGGDLLVMKDGQLKMLKWCVLNLDSVHKVPLNSIMSCLHTQYCIYVPCLLCFRNVVLSH